MISRRKGDNARHTRLKAYSAVNPKEIQGEQAKLGYTIK